MKRIIEIKFEENGKIFFDSAVIGEDITEEQAQKLVEEGIGKIIEISDTEIKKEKKEVKNKHG